MTKQEARFVEAVKSYYRASGRHTLPWRKTRDPYRILVSEMMLQQTQVNRVIEKYEAFTAQFPTLESLAHARLGDVLRVWQGLGYNRRAKMLHECAKTVLSRHGGTFPKTMEELTELPGIGSYTAGAILAFAYNVAVPIIETNVRSVYLHHFFRGKTEVHDSDIMVHVTRTLDTKHPRTWYYALMDYGAHIKKVHGNPNERSSHYARQTKFQGSDREIRGAIIRALTRGPQTRRSLIRELSHFDDIRVDGLLARLGDEGLLQKLGTRYTL